MKTNYLKKNKNNSYYSDDDKNIDLNDNKIINKKLNILIYIICFSFLIVLFRLFTLQIIENDDYINKLNNYKMRLLTTTSPRGLMYDRNGNILVNSVQSITITYYPPSGLKNYNKWETALKFSNDFYIDLSITSRDLKDLFIFKYPDLAKSKITSEDWDNYYNGILNDNDIYNLKLQRISDEDISILTETDKKAWLVYQKMINASSIQLTPVISNIDFEQASYFIENQSEYPGFDIFVDWQRNYPFDNTLKAVLGSISTSKTGLPAEKLNYYLALDYSRNERIGRSGLELQYNDLLIGNRSSYSIEYSEGLAKLNTVNSGNKGFDLKLSFDIDLQQKIEEIIINNFEAEANNIYRKYWDTTYCVVMDPNNGDVLALVCVKKSDNGYILDPVATYTEALACGSCVKGAVVYMGLDSNVISPGEKILDTPMKIKDTPLKKSSQNNLGYLDDIHALSQSSNIYMFNVAIRLAKGNYQYDQPLNIDINAFNIMRNYFSQFGLGIKTNIDLPNEATGYAGNSSLAGNLLDYAIGQYSTYTTLQLAQYVSTIANGGKLIQPRILIEAYNQNDNSIVYKNSPTILSTLDNSMALSRVQMGFREAVTTGLCQQYFNTLEVPVAAKSGTAEYSVDGLGEYQAPNSNIVCYAPYDNPQIAIAVCSVNARNDIYQPNISQKIAAEILEYYFK